MSTNEIRHYLGEPVFCVLGDGRIVRTAVAKFGLNDLQLLDYASAPHHSFSFEEAVTTAESVLSHLLKSEDITRKEEAVLRERLASLHTEDYKQEVFNQELTEGPKLHGILPRKNLGSDSSFPENYYQPGQIVFGLVTPTSSYIFTQAWRPRPYFILRTQIESVQFAPAWPDKLLYHLRDTHYRFSNNNLFITEHDARLGMVELFAQETGGSILPENIQIIPVEAENEARRERYESMKESMQTVSKPD